MVGAREGPSVPCCRIVVLCLTATQLLPPGVHFFLARSEGGLPFWWGGFACLGLLCPVFWDMAGFQEAGFLYEVTHPSLVIHAWEEDDASLGITSLKRHSCRNEWNALETDLMPLIPRFRFLPKGWVQNKSRKFHSVSVLGCQQLSKGKCSWSCCLTSEVAKLNPLL